MNHLKSCRTNLSLNQFNLTRSVSRVCQHAYAVLTAKFITQMKSSNTGQMYKSIISEITVSTNPQVQKFPEYL